MELVPPKFSSMFKLSKNTKTHQFLARSENIRISSYRLDFEDILLWLRQSELYSLLGKREYGHGNSN